MATTVTWWVDPDATGGGTGGDLANAYNSQNAFEAAQGTNLVTADNVYKLQCRSTGGTSDTVLITYNGWTTDATRYIEIIGDWYGTDWDTTKYTLVITSSGHDCVKFQVDNIRIRNVQMSSDTGDGITHYINSVGAEIWVTHCLIKGNANKTYSSALNTGNSGGAGSTYNFQNNLIIDWTGTGQAAINLNDADVTFYIENNTIRNCARGIRNTASAAHYVKNNQIDATDCIYGTFTNDNAFCDYNYISENLTDNMLGTHGAYNQVFTYTNAGTGDYSPTALNPSVGKGVDLSSQSPYPVTDDIKGITRVAPFDIGAYQYVAPSFGGQTPWRGSISRGVIWDDIWRKKI